MSSSWKMHPVTQLFLARFREFIRQPEAVFWSYVFPLVMMIALGLAFRSEPMEAISIVVQDGEGAELLAETRQQVADCLERNGAAVSAAASRRAERADCCGGN
jgi:hypothetical protein